MATTTVPRGTIAEGAETKLREILRSEIDTVLGPALDSFRIIKSAAVETVDDAELGRITRAAILDYGAKAGQR